MSQMNMRIDADLKKEAESVLRELGLTMSAAINIFLKQIVMRGGLPFAVTLPQRRTIKNQRKESLDSLPDFSSQDRRIEEE
ncbi:MAG: type II toxin-antitoxin system RelB/DinJ family antitoxin [Deltaproteobacteria bacterium]|jgi:DNA-damage-inducible protein J|nr:type II toxin-antitoxin system RelB/DinJ family antitoxin [Deltaproteobacteria bacterium]